MPASTTQNFDRGEHLAAQRARLRARCEAERNAVRVNIENAQARLESVDRGINAVRRVVMQPAFIVGAGALLVLIGPGRLVRLAGRSALFLNTARRFLPKKVVRFLPKK